MISILFVICLIWLLCKLIGLAFKATWSITKVIFTIVLFPITIICFAFSGMFILAFVLIIIGGMCTLIS